MTAFVSFLLRCLPFLCVLFGANALVSSTAWDYDAQARPSIAYDGASLPVFDYDSASTLSANETANRIREKGGAFAQFAKFLAAKSGIHKNSLEYIGDTHVYRIKEPDGTTFRIGESARGVRAGDGLSIRAVGTGSAFAARNR